MHDLEYHQSISCRNGKLRQVSWNFAPNAICLPKAQTGPLSERMIHVYAVRISELFSWRLPENFYPFEY